ncbi:MAG: hypothetical protein IK026_00705 [Eubacteriaceae bacterium]|nr:hypothetical protein [Eubacteriaceae bacterium]
MLINCPNCSKDYSNTVDECPHCHFHPVAFICNECSEVFYGPEGHCPKCGNLIQNAIPANKDILEDIRTEIIERVENAQNTEEMASFKSKYSLLKGYRDIDELEASFIAKMNQLQEIEDKHHQYDEALAAFENAETVADYEKLKEVFECVIDMEDAEKYVSECAEKITMLKYEDSCARMLKAKKKKEWKELQKTFASISDYLDASEMADKCGLELKNRKKKSAITTASVLCCVLILAFLTYFVFIPGYHYFSGMKLYKSGSYEEAIDQFTSAGGFKDAEESIGMSYYAWGSEDLDVKHSYQDAVDHFTAAGEYEDASNRILETYYKWGMSIVGKPDSKSDDDYQQAINLLKKAGDYPDAKEQYYKCNYDYALKLYLSENNEKVLKAESYFKIAVPLFEDASMMADNCKYASQFIKAMDEYKKGNLNKAQTAFADIPSDFTYKNYKSTGIYKSLLEKNSVFVKMCGRWEATGDNLAYVWQISKSSGYYYYWYTTYTDPSDYLDIKCVINDDGTVTIKGSAEYYVQTRYSSIAEGLREAHKSVSFEKTVSSTPSKLSIYDNVKLSYTGKGFDLTYSYVDNSSSVYFKYKYESFWHYKNKKQSY